MHAVHVITTSGTVIGQRVGGVVRFRGIPYAEAPVGARRFAGPVPRSPWRGGFDATVRGPVEPQLPSRLNAVVGDVEAAQDEDCLSLTITTPATTGPGRPVLVWWHGGGYSSGAGSLPWYDADRLADEGDLVVVAVNYRLGPLGFLRVPGVSDGRAGLDDLLLALDWVQADIAAFGGDPQQVTVAGQSAGAHAVMCLLAGDEVSHRFHRAILQSTPTAVAPLTTDRADDYAARFFDLLGYPADPERTPGRQLHRRLATEPVSRLLAAAAELARASSTLGSVAPPFLPALKDVHADDDVVARAARGAVAAGIELIIGTTRDEARAMTIGNPLIDGATDATVRQFLDSVAEPAGTLGRRPSAARTSAAETITAAMTDHIFVTGSQRLAATAADLGVPTWLYRFDWAPTSSALGACHCIELPFVFGTFAAWRAAPMLAGGDPAEMQELSRRVRTCWSTFVRTGRPPDRWPRHTASDRATLHLDRHDQVSSVPR